MIEGEGGMAVRFILQSILVSVELGYVGILCTNSFVWERGEGGGGLWPKELDYKRIKS